MFKYRFYIFHVVIISFFVGCGYKADPKWVDDSVQNNDMNITKIEK